MARNLKYDESHIDTLEGLVGVRMNAPMYVDDTNIYGQYQIIKELVDNSVDEILVTPHHNNIDICILTKGDKYQIVVLDDGRGAPIKALVRIFTVLHTSGKYDDSSYAASSGAWGVGAKVTAALSNFFCVVSKRGKDFGKLILNKGIIDKYATNKNAKYKADTGTVICFEPDETIFHDVNQFITNGIPILLDYINFVSVYNKGATFRVRVLNNTLIPKVRLKDEPFKIWDYLHSLPVGDVIFKSDPNVTIIDYLRTKFGVKSKVEFEIHMQKPMKDDNIGFNTSLLFTKNLKKESGGIIGTVNMVPINDPSSYHIVILTNQIKARLSKYIDDKDLKSYFDNIYTLPMYASILVQFQNAKFVGQTKKAFRDHTFTTPYRKYLNQFLNVYNETFWMSLYSFLSDDIVEKHELYTNKTLKGKASLKNINTSLSKFESFYGAKSTDNTKTELFIVEGDSAKGSARQARDSFFQAIFALSGKPINPMKIKTSTFRAKDIFKDLVKILGVTPVDKNLDKMNFDKIFLLTDADSDGYHIAVLVIGILYKINPLILSSGKVYISNPPLYVMTTGTNSLYIKDWDALMDCRISKVYSNALDISITNINNRSRISLTGNEFRDFCYLVNHIGTVIERSATTLAIDPLILEKLAGCVNYLNGVGINTNGIREKLGVDNVIYRPDVNALILCVEDVEINISLNNLVEEITSYILPELARVHWHSFIPAVTTKHTSTYKNTPITIMQLYQIFKMLDEAFPVTRFKGLGEMDPPQLGVTCLNPITRSFTAITSEGDVDKLFGMLGTKVDARKQLLFKEISKEL